MSAREPVNERAEIRPFKLAKRLSELDDTVFEVFDFRRFAVRVDSETHRLGAGIEANVAT